MGIVDDLIVRAGLYVGVARMVGRDHTGAARIVVTPLPGRGGVTLDYEVINPSTPDRPLGHLERTVVGRRHEAPAIMVVGDVHADSITVLRETAPGVFELGDEPAAFPMKVEISLPAPDQLRHSWWYGAPGEQAVERVVADLHRRP